MFQAVALIYLYLHIHFWLLPKDSCEIALTNLEQNYTVTPPVSSQVKAEEMECKYGMLK